MLGKSEMNTLYAETAPKFLHFLQTERDKLTTEIERLRGKEPASETVPVSEIEPEEIADLAPPTGTQTVAIEVEADPATKLDLDPVSEPETDPNMLSTVAEENPPKRPKLSIKTKGFNKRRNKQ